MRLKHLPCVSRLAAAVLWMLLAASALRAEKPNIVLILADDLGWGDLGCYGGKIPTPHCDRLAREGLRFTDFHTASSVCSPTRYSILTGRYNWRSRLQKGVLWGFSRPLIPPSRQTLASLLHDAGYATACIGKWHLGLGWTLKAGVHPDNSSTDGSGADFLQPVSGGPAALGFDRFFGITGSLDMPPFVYIDGDRPAGIPSVRKKYVRSGLAAPDFSGEQCPKVWASKAGEFVAAQAAGKRPFFLYLPLTSPHTPILPTREFSGKGLTPYADFVMETDWVVGQVLAALETARVAANTLVLFTSDNGCSPAAGIPALQKHGHFPNGPWRGTKADFWEGGHRVPLLARWPGRIQPGTGTAALTCSVDFFATLAEIVGHQPAAVSAEDSVSFVPVLDGRKPLRTSLVSHSIDGEFAIRQGEWKLCLGPGSGGWSKPKNAWPAANPAQPETLVQLYDLAADPGETKNLAETEGKRAADLAALLADQLRRGRSTPGPAAANDVPVSFHPKLLLAFPILQSAGSGRKSD